jgi:DNA-binding PadR family transcriptional regulator
MKKVNKSRVAILGLLFEKPRSGYSILQMMQQSTDYFWQETDASVYPMLKILEAEGKVTVKSEFVGKRERKIFEITQAGKDEFLAWMATPAEKENRRNELLLKLFLGATVATEDIVKQLALHQQKALKIKKEFKSIENDVLSNVSNEHPHKRFWLMALRYGILHNEAELAWLDECFNVLEKK